MKQHLLICALTGALACVAASCSDDDPTPAKTYSAGDFYNEKGVRGVVFKTSDGGRHGLMVSLDESAPVQWATDAAFAVKTGAIETNDGEENMQTIERIDGWRTMFPAVAWCAALNANGVEGWFLPAFYQLADFYVAFAVDPVAFNKTFTDNGGTAINPMPVYDYYWSSSENAITSKENEVAVFDFYNESYAFMKKNRTARVRAVHEF